MKEIVDHFNNFLTRLSYCKSSWRFIVPKLIGFFSDLYHPQYNGVKICRHYSHASIANAIHIVTIKPIEAVFNDKTKPLVECFHLKVTDGVGFNRVYFEGNLVDAIENPELFTIKEEE